jgi:hypothetical protein
MTNAEIEKLIRRVEADTDTDIDGIDDIQIQIPAAEAAIAEAAQSDLYDAALATIRVSGQFISYAEMQESAGIRAGSIGLNRKGLNRIV